MDGGFRHQGLEEIYRSGRTRRARRRSYREVQRILQLLDVAGKPEDKSVRKRLGCRFGRLP